MVIKFTFHLQNGFMTDFHLIIRLAIEKTTLFVKVGITFLCHFSVLLFFQRTGLPFHCINCMQADIKTENVNIGISDHNATFIYVTLGKIKIRKIGRAHV